MLVVGTYAELPPAFLRVATKVELYSCCEQGSVSAVLVFPWSLPEAQREGMGYEGILGR